MNDRLLIIGAHPDDEVLGPGGTAARLARDGWEVFALIVTEGCSTQYPDRPDLIARKQTEARRAAAVIGMKDVFFGGLPDMRLDGLPSLEVARCIEPHVRQLQPRWVFTHAEDDVNLDHGVVHRATLVACRPHAQPSIERLLAYPTPSSSEWGSRPFAPDTYFDVTGFLDTKIDAFRAYETEIRPAPHPRSPEVIRATAELHGSVIGTTHAEAFRTVRQVHRR